MSRTVLCIPGATPERGRGLDDAGEEPHRRVKTLERAQDALRSRPGEALVPPP